MWPFYSRPKIPSNSPSFTFLVPPKTAGKPTFSETFSQSYSSFTAVYFYETQGLTIYLTYSSSLCQYDDVRYLFDFVINDEKPFTTVSSFSLNRPFISIPISSQNLQNSNKFGKKYDIHEKINKNDFILSIKIRSHCLSNVCVCDNIPYVGIMNLGLTCYIAASLQYLASITPFVSLIFRQKPEPNTTSYELQRVFGQMKSSTTPLSITTFVSSFGSNLRDLIFIEQDAHEFITMLFDRLDTELGEEFCKKRKALFGVETMRIIQCTKIDIKSEIIEDSNDIDLPVKGVHNLKRALDKISTKEKMTGNSKWDTGDEKYGKQDAVLYKKYKILPPFLMFHLMRFTYNESNFECEEVKSSFDCPNEIDMSKYVIDNYTHETRYKMMGIVAHRGCLISGHYVAFISPKVDNDRWFQFNDSTVSVSSLNEARATFGGGKSAIMNLFGAHNDFVAYLVGYVRYDFIEENRKNLIAPVEIAPLLSNNFSANILNLTKLSNQSETIHKQADDDVIDLDKTKSFSPKKPILDTIYGKGERIDWNEKDKTIFELIGIPKNSNVKIYINYPKMNSLLGPIDGNKSASDFAFKGFFIQFIVTDGSINEPVFVYIENVLFSVDDTSTLFYKYNNDYLLVFENDFLTNDSPCVPSCSSITLISKNGITLNINEIKLKVMANTSYQSIQVMLAEHLNQRNTQINLKQNLKILPSRVLIYSGNKFLPPNKYKNALLLHKFYSLEYRILVEPATINSMNFNVPLTLFLTDLNHVTTKKEEYWFSKDTLIQSLFQYIPVFFNFPKNTKFLISIQNQGIATTILGPSPTEICHSQFVNINDAQNDFQNVRVDLIRGFFPKKMAEFKEFIKQKKMLTIEVRTENLWNCSRTIGFFDVNKDSTFLDIVNIVKIMDKMENINIKEISVKSENYIFFGLLVQENANVFDSLIKASQQTQANPRSVLNHERPVISIKLNPKSK
ncbi:hypothetical protein TRFO_37637 [Tritrichomonas foetus]|uniref:USP domain-containing protein n=1 Tax=Tritrichomonas foetus TaxID=1144522 RepID=A0A1J4JC37_9EUKA|nr:hypothetical protein TRFO_37637 [Tritrichomonas foetus]|eukprot:OHS96225.1 hypothetical protein TRFO_37637 [Tritrichomonas foetus]